MGEVERGQRIVTGTDPAADTEISYTIPAGTVTKLLALSVSLVTDANAANRRVGIILDDGTTEFFRSMSPSDHAASLTWRYSAGMGAPGFAIQNLSVGLYLPDITLFPGYRIRTTTLNRQATDNFGAPQLVLLDQ